LISTSQHGFLSKHSTVTNLMEAVNDWTHSIECNKTVKILYTDFSKAFDLVSVPKLVIKLKSYGIAGNLLSCLKSFLSLRSQKVRIGSSTSKPQNVLSGVPQGSVLGPFLFLIFINDLPSILDPIVTCKLFADDFKSYNLDDYRINPLSTQNALNSLNNWAATWQLQLAIPKCGSMLINSRNKFLDEND